MNQKAMKMIKKVICAVTLVAFTATTAMAAKAPWEAARPANMTEAHDKMAASAKKAYDRVGAKGFGEDVKTFFKWGWRNGRNENFPLSNMSEAQLKSLFVGRYHIMAFEAGAKGWVVQYHTASTMHRCYVSSGSKVKEDVNASFFDQSEAGLVGMSYVGKGKPNEVATTWGWPRIANPSTGEVSIWEHKGKWVSYQGFVQKEIPAVVAENCPNMPKSKSVNQGQTEFTYANMVQNGKPVSGFDVSFSQSSKSPLTLRMFYWAYPPK